MRLDAKHAFANIALTDNVVRFATRRYCDNPLIVQGPGAGPEVTAAGVFSDLLRLSAYLGAHLVMLTDVTAFAPATVANVGIGFDILGHTVEAVGDRVRLRRIEEPVVRIRSITGIAGDLPVEPAHNTAGRAVQAMHAALGAGFRLRNGHREGHSARLRAWADRRPPRWRRWSPRMPCCERRCRACNCSSLRWRGKSSPAARRTSTISRPACSAA